MPFRGRPPKPIDQRITRVKRREFGKVEAQTATIPKPPRGLSAPTRRLWRAYFGSPVARIVRLDSDAAALARLFAYEDWWLQAHRERDLVACLKLDQAMLKLEEQYGMTPHSRLRLGITFGEEKMTAERLRRMLHENDAEPAEEWEHEWA